jgi:hypothetical protein
MTPFERGSLRLRRALLRSYELFLYAMLAGIAVVAALPSRSTGAAPQVAPQCGKNQSSPPVMTR